MAAAILNAMIDCNAMEVEAFVMNTETVGHALVTGLASVFEADPRIKTQKDMRDASDLVAKELRLHLRAAREHFQRTGGRVWAGSVLEVN
jgi:hypothetical protein